MIKLIAVIVLLLSASTLWAQSRPGGNTHIDVAVMFVSQIKNEKEFLASVEEEMNTCKDRKDLKYKNLKELQLILAVELLIETDDHCAEQPIKKISKAYKCLSNSNKVKLSLKKMVEDKQMHNYLKAVNDNNGAKSSDLMEFYNNLLKALESGN